MDDKNMQRIEQSEISDKREALLFGLKSDDKIEAFENILSEELCLSDNLNEAIEKMVRAALTVEFGRELLAKPLSKNMVKTISSGILSDSELRRQAILIVDRFAKPKELNA